LGGPTIGAVLSVIKNPADGQMEYLQWLLLAADSTGCCRHLGCRTSLKEKVQEFASYDNKFWINLDSFKFIRAVMELQRQTTVKRYFQTAFA
jgi:hypothetical protein